MTHKQKTVEIQLKFVNTKLPQQLPGDIGFNTSATDNISLLHEFKLF